MDGPNHLKSVDDDQHGAGVFHREVFDLFLQPLSDRGALHTEVDAVRRVLRDLEQPVLNAEDGVLQTEIEGCLLYTSSFFWGKPVWGKDSIPHRLAPVY